MCHWLEVQLAYRVPDGVCLCGARQLRVSDLCTRQMKFQSWCIEKWPESFPGFYFIVPDHHHHYEFKLFSQGNHLCLRVIVLAGLVLITHPEYFTAAFSMFFISPLLSNRVEWMKKCRVCFSRSCGCHSRDSEGRQISLQTS